MKCIAALTLAAALMPAIAHAAEPPSTALVGSVTNGKTTSSKGIFACSGFSGYSDIPVYLKPIPSTYIRATASGPIIMNLGDMVYEGGINGKGETFIFQYSGTASLHFSTATSGLLHWDMSPAGYNIREGSRNRSFSNYSQSYNPVEHVLIVSFNVDFGGCSLPINGVFHG
jgi:hypothetical protein